VILNDNLKVKDTNIGVFAAYARKIFSFLNFLFPNVNRSLFLKKNFFKLKTKNPCKSLIYKGLHIFVREAGLEPAHFVDTGV
jgi:hypothetical protein